MERLYTPKQVGELLQCTTKTVYNLVAAGEIPHVRFGRLIRFDVEVLNNWIKERSKASTRDEPR